jgi:Uma2 family endonuclease
MLVSRPTLVSESEFLALPETMDRIELLDGEVIASPSPSVLHQELLSRLVQLLRSWAEERDERIFVGHSPLDVGLGTLFRRR